LWRSNQWSRQTSPENKTDVYLIAKVVNLRPEHFRMKALFILSASIVLFSCSKKNTTHYMASGTITGIDYGACVCCGGYLVKINGNDSSFRFYNFPLGSKVDSNNFPVKVNFDFSRSPSCDGTNIIVLKTVVKAE
jgi:hypothetical protein